jgi:hypothetical protein
MHGMVLLIRVLTSNLPNPCSGMDLTRMAEFSVHDILFCMSQVCHHQRMGDLILTTSCALSWCEIPHLFSTWPSRHVSQPWSQRKVALVHFRLCLIQPWVMYARQRCLALDTLAVCTATLPECNCIPPGDESQLRGRAAF